MLPPTYLCRVPPAHVGFGFGGILDALHLLLVELALTSRTLFGFFQGRLQGFDPLHHGAQTLLHFWDLRAKVSIVPHQLQARVKQESQTKMTALRVTMMNKVCVDPHSSR